MDNEKTNMLVPIMPLPENNVAFPGLIMPIMVTDSVSVQMVNEILTRDKILGVFATKFDEKTEKTRAEQNTAAGQKIHSIGCKAQIIKMLRLPDGSMKFLVQPTTRIRIIEIVQQTPYSIARIEELEDIVENDEAETALMRSVIQLFESVVAMAKYLPDELRLAALNTTDPGRLADLIAANLNISAPEKQKVLEELSAKNRLETVLELLHREETVLGLTKEIQRKTTEELEKAQRDYFLREQMRQIQNELGDGDISQEIDELRKKIENSGMHEEAMENAVKELERLSRMNPSSAEFTVARTYLDWLVEMPWTKSTDDRIDIKKSREILDLDHYGLDEVKERVLEFLAVRKLKPDVKSPILLFVGPPGTGKTSLGKSIAASMSREFVRISLGGMKDEAEIRGHRRTYVGALPGRIIQGIKRANSNNPVFMLDEIDKIGQDFRGDPASALLEVLDPEQNSSFVDHYLDVKFDLSKIIFIATANYIDPIPQVLLDRMEMLKLPGYTDYEKLQIAKQHIIPRQKENHGLSSDNIEFTDGAISFIINFYTREAGLRNLDRSIASICRKTAKGIAEEAFAKVVIDEAKAAEMLGPEKFVREKLLENPREGVVTGLAWTPYGGEVLMVECATMPGKGHLTLTGSLGEVMKESAQIALSYIRSIFDKLGLEKNIFEEIELHIHVPAGAIPKDGPSAGITIASAIASKLLHKIPQKGYAMTGEITLRGDVLPIGGLKEKALAAHRLGIKNIIMPADNTKDLREIPEEIASQVQFIPVQTVEEVFSHIFPS